MYNFEEVIPGKLTRSWYVWKAVFFLLFALSALAKVAWIIRNNHELVLLDVVLLTILAGLLWASSQVFTTLRTLQPDPSESLQQLTTKYVWMYTAVNAMVCGCLWLLTAVISRQ